MIIKLYKSKRNKIICYIRQQGARYDVCTGKPSDASCLCWHYDNLEAAEETAAEYVNNYMQF